MIVSYRATVLQAEIQKNQTTDKDTDSTDKFPEEKSA